MLITPGYTLIESSFRFWQRQDEKSRSRIYRLNRRNSYLIPGRPPPAPLSRPRRTSMQAHPGILDPFLSSLQDLLNIQGHRTRASEDGSVWLRDMALIVEHHGFIPLESGSPDTTQDPRPDRVRKGSRGGAVVLRHSRTLAYGAADRSAPWLTAEDKYADPASVNKVVPSPVLRTDMPRQRPLIGSIASAPHGTSPPVEISTASPSASPRAPPRHLRAPDGPTVPSTRSRACRR